MKLETRKLLDRSFDRHRRHGHRPDGRLAGRPARPHLRRAAWAHSSSARTGRAPPAACWSSSTAATDEEIAAETQAVGRSAATGLRDAGGVRKRTCEHGHTPRAGNTGRQLKELQETCCASCSGPCPGELAAGAAARAVRPDALGPRPGQAAADALQRAMGLLRSHAAWARRSWCPRRRSFTGTSLEPLFPYLEEQPREDAAPAPDVLLALPDRRCRSIRISSAASGRRCSAPST